MATVKTPVRLLEPGDVVLVPGPGLVLSTAPGARLAVLCVAHTDPGPVGLSLGRLGELPPHLDRVATVSWQPDALVDVDRPDLTPAQAAAAELLEVVRSVSRGVAPHPNTARALLDRIEPPHQAELFEQQRFDRVSRQPDGTFQHSYRGQPVPAPARLGVPVDVARTLLRQAELFEQLFGLHDVLDVAYVADTLRAAAGVAPMHDGPTSERSAALELRRQAALGLLQDVERLAAVGHDARVRILHDEIEVSSATMHENLARCFVPEPLATVRVLGGVATFQDVDLERLRRLDGAKVYVRAPAEAEPCQNATDTGEG
jgi:hypothetical protein